MIPKKPLERPPHVVEGEWKGRKCLYRSDRIIVKFKSIPEGSQATAESLVSEIVKLIPNGAVLRPPRATGRAVFAIDPTANILELLKNLAERNDVEYAEPDIVDTATAVPNDPRYSAQWGLPKINAPAAWNLETGSTSSVIIGIIDSGISMASTGGLDHPDLNDSSRYLLGTDYVDGGDPRDLCGHGTHVTGIAAALTNNAQGVAGTNWQTHVYICRTLDASGYGSAADFADAAEEIVDWAVARSMKAVINYSGGGAASQTKQDACKYINDHGMILCAAAGNDSGGPVIFPAAYSSMFDGVIAVGATDSADHVASFSNAGPEVTVVAPGVSILSTTPTYAVTISVALNYDYLDGTSMATPYVTGLVALMWSRHPAFSNKKIRDCLTRTAVKLGTGNFNNSWGYGRIDVNQAVRCGDLVFTHFTFLTRFTHLTPFTIFTRLTSLTAFTRFSVLTRFTRFSLSPLTSFTRFITAFGPATTGPEPGPEIAVRPFIRFGGTVFSPQELEIGRFKELAGVAGELRAAGITSVNDLATSDVTQLASTLGYSQEDAGKLIQLSQQLMQLMAAN